MIKRVHRKCCIDFLSMKFVEVNQIQSRFHMQPYLFTWQTLPRRSHNNLSNLDVQRTKTQTQMHTNHLKPQYRMYICEKQKQSAQELRSSLKLDWRDLQNKAK